jgi:hypothetical protein
MLLRATVAVMNRWRELTTKDEGDRGDSPVPTVIIWIGIAVVAIGLIGWAASYINSLTAQAPANIPSPTISQ